MNTDEAAKDGWRRYDAQMKFYEHILSDVMNEAEAAGISPRQKMKLELGIEEIAVNIINYAYDDPGYMWVKTAKNGDFFRVEFADHGKKFDPLAKDMRPNGGKVSLNQEPGGYGIFLVKKNFAAVSYLYEEMFGKFANHLTMEISLS